MQTQMQIFNHDDFGELGVLMIDGKPYFPATDCAKVLGYNQPEHAIKRHCMGDGCMKRTVIDRLGREQQKLFINEGNLYRLIVRSKLPEAERFEKFVFDEVLPSIRKYGGYVTGSALDKFIDDPEAAMEFFNRLKDERSKKAELEKRIEEAEPKARYFDVILQCPEAVQVSIIAKDYGYSAMKLNELLHAFHFQYKVGKTWLPYQEYVGEGYTVSRTYQINETKSVVHTCFTQKGRFFIYNFLKKEGILPLTERTAESQQISLE